MPAKIITSFARGELTPALYGRVDTETYHAGLKTARNIYVQATGGVSNRSGTLFVGFTKYHDKKSRVVRFKFKTTDTYALEFGHEYVRPIRNDQHILETGKTITGATQADPVVVTVTSHGYVNGDEFAISSVADMTELNGRRFKVANKTANTVELEDPITGGTIDGTGFGAYTSGGSAQRVYEIVTPYQESELFELNFVQSADVITIVHPNHDPRDLTRTAHNVWTLAVISFAPTQDHPSGLAAAIGGASGSDTYKYVVTAIADETSEESLPALNATTKTVSGATQADPVVITAMAHGFNDGDETELNGIVGMIELNGRRFKVANKATNTYELKGEDGTGHTAYTSGGTANRTHAEVTNGNATLDSTNYVDVSWSEEAGAQKYAVYRRQDGIYGLLGETEDLTYRDDGKTPAFDSGPPRPREPFLGTGNKPGAVSYYEQRQVFGGSDNKPDTNWYTQTGNFKNLSISTPGRAADAITATLNSLEVNRIRHYIPLENLITLTSGEEWRIDSGEATGGFAGETIRQKPQTSWGAGFPRPVTVGATILYVPEHAAAVRSIGFSLEIDGYTGTDMTLRASHLFRHETIIDFAYAKGADPLVAAVLSNGQIAIMTFLQEQEVIAWTHWDTPGPGYFESVAALRSSSTEPDEAFYFVVRRVVNGQTVRYIERVHSRRFKVIQDAFFVDSGVTLDEPRTITGISLANPAVVTAVAHSFANGDEVDLHDITWVTNVDEFDNHTQPDQLNGRRVTVRNKAANTFELEDDEGNAVDSSAYNAYVTGGAARKAVSTISGLHHLEGETIVALADGNVVKNLTVVAGTVTLTRKASRVHLGKLVIADIGLLNIEDMSSLRTLQGKLKHIAKITVRFERSRGLWAGPDSLNLTEMKQRELEAYGVPTELLTGDKDIVIEPDWNIEGGVFMRQRDPLPLTITALIPHFEVESDEDD